MNRDTIEKEQVARKIGEIVPFINTLKNFGWVIPECDADPVYEVYPDVSDPGNVPFKSFKVNLQTGWHSEVIYRDDKGTHRLKEGVTPVKDEWSDFCWRSDCVCKQ
jgi:hypothetical protein